MFSSILELTMLVGLALSAPGPQPSFGGIVARAAGDSAASMLLTIAPTSGSCSGAPFPSECATNVQAAPYLISAMGTYGITAPPEMAALLSLVAFETGDFKYNINHYPGRAGQGTRNMQMPNYNLLYAQSIAALAAPLSAITTASSITGISDTQLDAIRALVLPDQYSWASAAWFLTSQCASARPALQAGGQAGYSAYLACVGTTPTTDRLAYWARANTALGIS